MPLAAHSKPLSPSEQKRFIQGDECEDSDYHALARRLNAHLAPLVASGKHDSMINTRGLSTCTKALQIFMDQELGLKTAAERRPVMAKLPNHFFTDLAEGGMSEKLLKAVFEYRHEMQKSGDSGFLRKFEFTTDKAKSQGIHLLKHLADSIPWERPRIFLYNTPRTSKESGPYKISTECITGLVEQLGGTVTQELSECTHILLPSVTMDEADTEDYNRVVRAHGTKALFHWWYFPDCYDCWLVASEDDEVDENLKPPKDGRWKLTADWIFRSHKFNEWGNELDFEVPDEDLPEDLAAMCGISTSSTSEEEDEKRPPPVTGRPPGQKRKLRRSDSRAEASKRAKTTPAPVVPTDDEEATKNEETAEEEPTPTLRTSRRLQKKALVQAAPSPSVVKKRNVAGASRRRALLVFETLPSRYRAVEAKLRNRDVAGSLAPEMEAAAKEWISETATEEAAKFFEALEKDDENLEKEEATPEEAEEPAESSARTVGIARPEGPEGMLTRLPSGMGGTSHLMNLPKDHLPTVCNYHPSKDGSEFISSAELPPERSKPAVGQPLVVRSGLPPAASWFSPEAVHELERMQLPLLFEGPASNSVGFADIEKSYKKLRNSIVSKYQEHPATYLSFSECRRHFSGDASTLLRLHTFLEHWGLINFSADPSTFPARDSRPPRDFRLLDTEYPAGTWATTSKVDTSTEDNIMAPRAVHCVSCNKVTLYAYYVLRPGTLQGVSAGLVDRAAWCTRCFAQGKLPSSLNQRHFQKVEIPVPLTEEGSECSRNWTPAEAERLLEAVEEYEEDWQAVARRVGTKTAEDCVAFFVQLPIEQWSRQAPADGPRRETLSAREALERAADGNAHREKDLPALAEFNNSLSTQLAFVASAVHPLVSGAAAKAALDALADLRNSDEGKQQQTGNSATGEEMAAVSAVALGAAAAASTSLASAEETNAREIMGRLVDERLKRLRLRMQQFKSLERMVFALGNSGSGTLAPDDEMRV